MKVLASILSAIDGARREGFDVSRIDVGPSVLDALGLEATPLVAPADPLPEGVAARIAGIDVTCDACGDTWACNVVVRIRQRQVDAIAAERCPACRSRSVEPCPRCR